MKTKLLAATLLFALAWGSVTPALAATKYTSCAALNKAFPNGVAQTSTAQKKLATSFLRPKVNKSVYDANKTLDKDKDKVICPVKAAATDAYTAKWGTFSELTYAGVGDDVIELSSELATGIMEFSYVGEGNFVIWTYDKDMGMIDLVANEIGSVKSASAFGLSYFSTTKTKYIEVTGSGDWEIKIKPVSTAPALSTSGSGSGVFKGSISSGKKSFTHDGSRNFVIWQWCTNGVTDLLVNEIGSYSGSKVVKGGTCLFVVDADGSWTFN